MTEPEDPAAGEWRCPSCGADARRDFCAACGERRPDPHALTLRHFAGHAVEAFTHADSRLWRTLRALVLRPGSLTRDYLAGRRVPYMAPLQLFLVLNLVFFVALPWVGWNVVTTPLAVHLHQEPYSDLARQLVDARAAGRAPADYAAAFDRVGHLEAKSLVIVMVPLFALVSSLLLWRWRQPFAVHFVFALHFYAFWLAFQIVALGLAAHVIVWLVRRGAELSNSRVDDAVTVLTVAALAVYLGLALRSAFARRGWTVAVQAAVLAACTLLVLQAYRFVLFLATWLVV